MSADYRFVLPQVDCEDAGEFLRALSPIGPHFLDAPLADRWVFRGQSADWPLVPSMHRKGGEKLRALTSRDVGDPGERRLAARDILTRFFDIADRRGLVLPDDSQTLRERLEVFNSERGDQFVPDGGMEWGTHEMSLSLLALAQHYGLPTPLLDWSRQAWIAAFFAAEGAGRAEISSPPGRIVVWGLYYPMLGKQDHHSSYSVIRLVTAPSATNSNLAAQQGVFTLFQPQYAGAGYPEDRPMEEVLAELAADAEPDKSFTDRVIKACRLRKFTLAATQADRLLFLLSKLDITPSAIYPGYGSIIRDIEQENRSRRWTG